VYEQHRIGISRTQHALRGRERVGRIWRPGDPVQFLDPARTVVIRVSDDQPALEIRYGYPIAEPLRGADAETRGPRRRAGDTALRLGHFFGMSPQSWLNLQSLYELRVAQKKIGRSIKALPRLKELEPTPA